jgi:hypothetical protein
MNAKPSNTITESLIIAGIFTTGYVRTNAATAGS